MPQNTRSVSFGPIPTEGPVSPGQTYILAIGINEYRHITPLRNAVRDALDVVDILQSKYQFSRSHITLLLDAQATQRAIFKALDQLIETVRANDIVLIYFSGHGVLQNNINEGYWIPVDGEAGNYGSAIPNSLLTKYLKSINSLHTVVIADACFAGSMFGERGEADLSVDRLERIPSRWLLTSCRETKAVDSDYIKPNSPFADSMLLHLKTNQEDVLPISSLAKIITRDVGNNYEQIPRCAPLYGVGDRGGEFVFRLKDKVVIPESPEIPKPPGAERKVPPETAPVIPPQEGWKHPKIKNEHSLMRSRMLWVAGLITLLATIVVVYLMTKRDLPQTAHVIVETGILDLGQLTVGQTKAFAFKLRNESQVSGKLGKFISGCSEAIVTDPLLDIPPGSMIEYKGSYTAVKPVGASNCLIRVEGGNMDSDLTIPLKVMVIDSAGSDDGHKPPPTDQKACLVAPVSNIDLGTMILGNTKRFAFKINNTCNGLASNIHVMSSNNQVTAALGSGTIIKGNKQGSFGGVWKPNVTGVQICTLTVAGSNIVNNVKLVLRINVMQANLTTCKITCQAGDRIGATITLIDPNTNLSYIGTVNASGDATFNIPCHKIGQIFRVNVRMSGSPPDNFNLTADQIFTLPK